MLDMGYATTLDQKIGRASLLVEDSSADWHTMLQKQPAATMSLSSPDSTTRFGSAATLSSRATAARRGGMRREKHAKKYRKSLYYVYRSSVT